MTTSPHYTQSWNALRDLAASFTSGQNYFGGGHVMSELTELVGRRNAKVFVFDLMNSRVEPDAACVRAVAVRVHRLVTRAEWAASRRSRRGGVAGVNFSTSGR